MVTIIISVNFKLDPPDQVAASSRNLISSTNSNVNVNAIAQQSSRSKLLAKHVLGCGNFKTSLPRCELRTLRCEIQLQSNQRRRLNVNLNRLLLFQRTKILRLLLLVSNFHSRHHNFNICIIYDLLYHSISVSSVVKTQMIYEKNCEN